jgi:hypothetical protein
MLIDKETIKTHLNIDSEYEADDAYLEYLEGVAKEIIEKHIDRTFDDIVAEEGEIPQPLLHAMLLMIGNMYANRESVSYSPTYSVPNSLSYILSLFRSYDKANT